MRREETDGQKLYLLGELLALVMSLLSSQCDGILLVIMTACAMIIAVCSVRKAYPDKYFLCVLAAAIFLLIGVFFGLYQKDLKDGDQEEQEAVSDFVGYSLEISFEELILTYQNDGDVQSITTDIAEDLSIESVELESYDYDFKVQAAEWDGRVLKFEGVPSGNSVIKVKLQDFDLLSSPLKLNRKDLIEDKWTQTFILQRECDFKGFKIQILDSKGRALEEGTCEVLIDDAGSIDRLPMDGNGEMPFEFYGKEGLTITVNLYYMEEKYTQAFCVDDLKGNAILIFEDILSEESLKEQQYLQEKAEQEERVQTLIEEESKYNPGILLENSVEINTNIRGDYKIIKEWTDSLYDYSDEKYYSIEIDQPGAYWLDFAHNNLTEDSIAWTIRLCDADENEYFRFYSNMNRESTESSVVGLKEGTYTIEVFAYNRFSDAKYKVSVRRANVKDYETEFNDDVLSASVFKNLESNSIVTCLGNLSNEGDHDFYLFTLDKPGVIAFKFEHENLTEDRTGWIISVRDKKNSELLATIFSNWKVTETYSPNIGLEAGSYYIEVEPYDHTDEVYALSIACHASELWEQEYNNEVKDASTIFTNTNIYGALAIEGDEDYFSYDCEATGTYRISFVHKNLTKDDCGWVIDMLDKDGNLLWEEPLYSNWNQTEVKQSAFLEAGETYYLKVYHYNYSSADYMLKLENG